MNTSDGYFEIATIPAGSRHILIEEMAPCKNYLSLNKANTNKTYLNGDRFILMPGEFMVEKSMGLYERENEQEKIKIPGPIKYEMILSVSIAECINRNQIKQNTYFQFLNRSSLGVKTRDLASNTNIRCQRIRPKCRYISGNWETGRLAQPPVAVARSNVCPYAMRRIRASSMRRIAGQMPKAHGPVKKFVYATRMLVLHTGGWVLGNFALLPAGNMVSYF